MLLASERMNSVSQSFGEWSIEDQVCAIVTVACACDRKHGTAGVAVMMWVRAKDRERTVGW